jgi:hypothetical protein
MRYIKLVSIASVLCAPRLVYSTGAVPTSDIFSLGQIKIGTTTLDEVQKMLGPSDFFRPKKDDESPLSICYKAESPNGDFFVLLESGATGGFKRVTGFSISRVNPEHACGRLQATTESVQPANGVEIGESRESFEKRFTVRFAPCGSNLSYELDSTREPGAEELESLKKMWPNEKSYRLDVAVRVCAHFDNDHLTSYTVSKVESY